MQLQDFQNELARGGPEDAVFKAAFESQHFSPFLDVPNQVEWRVMNQVSKKEGLTGKLENIFSGAVQKKDVLKQREVLRYAALADVKLSEIINIRTLRDQVQSAVKQDASLTESIRLSCVAVCLNDPRPLSSTHKFDSVNGRSIFEAICFKQYGALKTKGNGVVNDAEFKSTLERYGFASTEIAKKLETFKLSDAIEITPHSGGFLPKINDKRTPPNILEMKRAVTAVTTESVEKNPSFPLPAVRDAAPHAQAPRAQAPLTATPPAGKPPEERGPRNKIK